MDTSRAMDQRSKRRGWPSPDALNMKPIAFNLEEALAIENTYRPNLLVIQQDLLPWEVTLNDRDSAIHRLRFLRVWFDLPQSVFFTAVTYLDLFLSRMKVQEKYIRCLAISCIHAAAEKEGYSLDDHKLEAASRNVCSIRDMLRMSDIVKEKLRYFINIYDRSATCADFLTIFLEVLEYISRRWEVRLHASEVLKKDQLLVRLEVLLSDSRSAYFRSSILALVLIKLELEGLMAQAVSSRSMYFVGELIQLLAAIRELQLTCKIKTNELVNCYHNASIVLKHYDDSARIRCIANPMWSYRPSFYKGNFYRTFQVPLDIIEEQNQIFP
ncbi:hypothetical protein NQ314_013170 [Rhamnusium bicolor]|uniref:Cyclin N-terminal domain-containing protein n=1 Tax=Rhamnusium bicolor TaxID=1586634 RepID=A0AAV8XA62_9CUCU|nr:hypothetical protein NQ314_013170 [Rhamnusium bicolor]